MYLIILPILLTFLNFGYNRVFTDLSPVRFPDLWNVWF